MCVCDLLFMDRHAIIPYNPVVSRCLPADPWAATLSCLQETLEYFANPDNLNSEVLPPGMASWDPAPYLASAIPIAVSVVGVNFVHEIGHRIAAFIRKVKLGPTYFVPNLQVIHGRDCWSVFQQQLL